MPRLSRRRVGYVHERGFTERGIKEQNAYGRERFRLDPRFAARRAALISAKGQVDQRSLPFQDHHLIRSV
jgi:hypothetical protein